MYNTSVIIRTFNEGSRLGDVLRVIRNQVGVALNEILVVDTGSGDMTLAVARAHNCRIIQMDPKEFSFGRALNLGVQAAMAEFVVFISPDCLPTSNRWLLYLVSPLAQEEVAAVFGRQVPFIGVNPYEEVTLANSFPHRSKPNGSSPVGKSAFSNANCAINRKFLIQAPFDESLASGEEWSIVNYILKSKFKIIYEPRAAVYHSHSVERLYLKTYIYSYSLRQTLFNAHLDNIGYLIVHFFLWLFKDLAYFVRQRNFPALIRAPIHEFVSHFYLWKGSFDCRLNRPPHFDPRFYRRLRFVLEKVASPHPKQIPFH